MRYETCHTLTRPALIVSSRAAPARSVHLAGGLCSLSVRVRADLHFAREGALLYWLRIADESREFRIFYLRVAVLFWSRYSARTEGNECFLGMGASFVMVSVSRFEVCTGGLFMLMRVSNKVCLKKETI